MTSLPPYHELEASLRAAGLTATAAEAHGMLCGTLVGGGERRHWVAGLSDQPPDRGDLSVGECLDRLDALWATTRAQLEDAVLGLELLLQDDEEALAARAQALADWVQGFLYGIGAGRERATAGDAAEILRDFAEIARAGLEAPATEADERAYAELVEYVRTGVLLLHEELNPLPPAPTLQ